MEEPVRSQARLDQTKRLSNAILRRTVVNVVLFIVVYLVLFAGFMTTLGSAVSNFVYELLGYDYALHALASNLFLVLTAIGFVAGIVLVVRSGISRALRYFDLLLDSVSDILAKSDGPVMLPGELAPTAMALNTIKATSEQNERAAKAAEDRKNELVVYLAHDIKTPLTSIIGYLTLLEESPDLPLEVRERYTGITLDKAYRLEELLDEFFEITRYNLQTIPIERSRFDAALFVNQVVDEFFPLAEGRRLNLVYEGPAELSVFADAGRVARVLNNVIKNAVAYADPGTDVRVRTGLVTAADGFVWWELTVSDQGRELSPQHLERIFEKFYRADESRGSAAGGAGLGLALCAEILLLHGSRLEIESEPGKGTCMSFVLPPTAATSTLRATRASRRSPSGSPRDPVWRAPDGGLLQHASVLMGARLRSVGALCGTCGRPASRLPRTVLAVTIGGLRKRRHVPLGPHVHRMPTQRDAHTTRAGPGRAGAQEAASDEGAANERWNSTWPANSASAKSALPSSSRNSARAKAIRAVPKCRWRSSPSASATSPSISRCTRRTTTLVEAS